MNITQLQKSKAWVLCNIEGVPDASDMQWIQVLPNGELPIRDGRGPFVVKDADAVIQETLRHLGENQMVVDYEHQTIHAEKNGQPAPAAGWVQKFAKRSDGIWALVKWNASASAQIIAREYRYISPVFTNRSQSSEIKCIHHIALTNVPAIEGMAALAKSERKMESEMEEIIKLLGLDAEVSVDSVIEALQALIEGNKSEPVDLTKYVPIEEFEKVVAEVNKLSNGLTEIEATAHVDQYIATKKLPPYLKEWAVTLCTQNKDGFEAFVEKTSGPISQLFQSQIPNGAFRQPTNNQKLEPLEAEICAKLGNDPDEYAALRNNENGEL